MFGRQGSSGSGLFDLVDTAVVWEDTPACCYGRYPLGCTKRFRGRPVDIRYSYQNLGRLRKTKHIMDKEK